MLNVNDMTMDEMREHIVKLEDALLQIADKQYNDFGGNPSNWASVIAGKALGRKWKDGQLVTD